MSWFLGCWDLDGFQEPGASARKMDLWIQEFKKTLAIDPENHPVLIPGEPEFKLEELRKQGGIPLVKAVCEDIEMLSKTLNIPHPL